MDVCLLERRSEQVAEFVQIPACRNGHDDGVLLRQLINDRCDHGFDLIRFDGDDDHVSCFGDLRGGTHRFCAEFGGVAFQLVVMRGTGHDVAAIDDASVD